MSTSLEPADSDVPSHRACAHCRSQKVRCIPDETNPDVCQRCARAGRPCVTAPLQKRRQRKRTDTRVAELEREMRLMRTMLKNKTAEQAAQGEPARQDATVSQTPGSWDTQNVPNVSSQNKAPQSLRPNHVRLAEPASTSLALSGTSKSADDSERDVVDRDIISMATARQLFESYRKNLFPHYPMVPIPADATADEIRHSKPMLFLATITAAAGKDHPDISGTLDQEVLHAYARKGLLQSEKSLELIQSLLVSAVWYHPPAKFSHLKYYEYIHMAATMATDIGIGSRPVPPRVRFGNNSCDPFDRTTVHHLEDARHPDLSMTPRSTANTSETASIESRRTYLSCYAICTGVSMSLRRPNMLRVTAHLKDCVEYLERSPDALPTDRMLVAWVKLMMITDEISNSMRYDDPDGIASITELRTHLLLKDFAKRLNEWYANVPESALNGSLALIYWHTRLYLHEVALHVDHSPEDFKAPYQMGVIHPWDREEVPTQVLAETLAECVSCSHSMINAFLALDVESSRALPVLAYVRVSFAAFILAKMCLSACHPESQIGRVLDRSSLKAEGLLDRAILQVRAIVGPQRCKIPAIFLALLFKLRQWCLNPLMIETLQDSILGTGMTMKSLENQEQQGTAIDATRIIEQTSTPRSSVGSTHDSASVENASETHDGSSASQSYLTPQSFGTNTQNVLDATGIPTSDANSETSAPPISAFLNPGDQMQVDPSFFPFFQDMNTLITEGFWASTPNELLDFLENYDWPGPSTIDQSTIL